MSSRELETLAGNGGASLNFDEIVRRGDIVIADVSETPEFSEEQGDAIASLLIIGATNAGYFQKKRFYIGIDDAEKVLGENLGNWLARGAKRNTPMILSVQDLTSLKNRFTDISGKALSQPRTQIVFQQKDSESLDAFAQIVATGMLDFSLQFRQQQFQDGYDWHEVKEHGRSVSNKATWSRTATHGDSAARNVGLAHGQSDGENWQETDQAGTSLGMNRSHSSGTTSGWNDASGSSSSFEHIDSRRVLRGSGLQKNSSMSGGASQGETAGESENVNRSRSRGAGGNAARSVQNTVGRTDSVESSVAESTGGGRDTTESVTVRNIPLARHRIESFPDRMLYDVPTQFWMVKKALRNLGIGECIVSVGNRAAQKVAVFRIAEPFAGFPKLKDYMLRSFKRCIQKRHPIFFEPNVERWNGKHATNVSAPSSNGTPRTASNGSAPASSIVQRLLRDVRQNSHNGNGTSSDTSGECS